MGVALPRGMRSIRLSALILSSILAFAPGVHAAKPSAPAVVVAASQLELEISELTRDGTRRTMTLTLLLADNTGRVGAPQSELKTRAQHSEREASYYWARVQPESTPSGMRYAIDVRRASDGQYNNTDMRIEVTRVLPVGVATLLGKVARPDGSSLVVTATLR